MKIVKKLAIIGLSAILLASATGCSDEGKRAKIKELELLVQGLEQQNKSLQAQKDGLTITEEVVETSLYTIEGETVPTFQTIEGKIKFPNRLQVPNARDDVNSSYMQVGSMFKFTPSSNWLVKMNGATLEVNHPSKIWGSIKAVGVSEIIPEDQMKPQVQSFFNNFPSTKISYRKVFMDDQVIGMIGKAAITVDKKPYVVNAGFMTRGEYGQLVLFSYEDDKTGVQQELIDLLISSGTFGDAKVTLE